MISNRLTVLIHINGIVQGVGFRPFVAKLADSLGVYGTVLNSGGTVIIVAQAESAIIDAFVETIKSASPANSYISQLIVEEISAESFDNFRILDSETNVSALNNTNKDTLYIPPDIATCDYCIDEMHDPANRRYGHPFISCASCGPRYTIIDKMPYDRCNTSMSEFEMCDDCAREYADHSDRRYHAQTISCHKCGPELVFNKLTNATEANKNEALECAVRTINNGGVIAIKGIGGYHIACSAYKESAVRRVRDFKKRDAKPFAVMFPNVVKVSDSCMLSLAEIDLLKQPSRPIVLLLRKEFLAISSNEAKHICSEVYGDSRFQGAFLPYTPIHTLLTERCGALVMTSANISGSPIVKDDFEMIDLAHAGSLDGVLYNRRKIRISVDDSVLNVVDGKSRMLRYSRGFAPLPFVLPENFIRETPALALGGDLKASFALCDGKSVYCSQYYGDLENEAVRDAYIDGVKHMEQLLRIEPENYIRDLHPGYYSAEIASQFANCSRQNADLPTNNIAQEQHHYAHIASVICEHNITDPVIGVAFDGTGYGYDGTIWGGEFICFSNNQAWRAGQLGYVDLAGGDKATLDSKFCSFSYLHAAGVTDTGSEYWYTDKSNSELKIVSSMITNHVNTIKSSSMGRLFDAVSAILGFSDYNSYEGQSAIVLENAAYKARLNGVAPYSLHFNIISRDKLAQNEKHYASDNEKYNAADMLSSGFIADQIGLIRELYQAKISGVSRDELAFGFQEAVAQMVLDMCQILRREYNIGIVALSGGVFQNSMLLERCIDHLKSSGFVVYYNQKYPPNDGGIALGQLCLSSGSRRKIGGELCV